MMFYNVECLSCDIDSHYLLALKIPSVGLYTYVIFYCFCLIEVRASVASDCEEKTACENDHHCRK